jgi:hypothetical protein
MSSFFQINSNVVQPYTTYGKSNCTHFKGHHSVPMVVQKSWALPIKRNLCTHGFCSATSDCFGSCDSLENTFQ